MSQKGKSSILQRIKAKLGGRSQSSRRYSRDVPQDDDHSNDPLDSRFTRLDLGTAASRPTTAGTEKQKSTSPLAGKTGARQNGLRTANNDLARDDADSRPTTAKSQPINARNHLQGTNKERRALNATSERDGSSDNRRRSDTAESMSIPRKPVKDPHGSIAKTNGSAVKDEPVVNGLVVRGDPRPDSMAIPIRASRGSVESDDMPMSEGADGTQKLIPSLEFGKSDFSDFDLTDTVDTDHQTYHAPAVTHEVVRPHVHEIIHKEVHRDVHNHEYRHYIQPVFEREFLPARHFVPDEEGNLREVSVKDLEGIPGCTGASSDYRLETKQMLDRHSHSYEDGDHLIGQTA